MLCSDGLSDRGWVEKSWKDYAKPVVKGKISLETAVESLITLANEKNGHDNTSVVITRCLLSPEPPILFDPKKAEEEVAATVDTSPMELTEASKALLYANSLSNQSGEPVGVETMRGNSWLTPLAIFVLVLLLGLVGYGVWRSQNTPNSQPQPSERLQSP